MTKGSVVSSSTSSARVAPGLLARRLVRLTAGLAVAWLLAGTMARAQQAAEPAELAQARQLFDALDYEQALPLLDRAVAMLEQQAARDPNSRQMLTAAYGMRARARFGIGNKDGAVADFRSALSIDPGFALGQGVSPRIVALLDEVKSSTIGALEILTDPGDVNVLVDGAPARVDAGKVSLAAGAHAIKITRPGYKPADQSVVVSAGQSVPLRLTLERVSTVLTVISSPPGVEVVVNGTSRGKTAGGPLSPSLATLPQQLGVPPDQVSQPLAIGDLGTGTLDVELRRPCYATEHRQLPVQGLSDVMLDPVKMKPAVGTLSIDSDPAGATVLVDGEDKGSAPVTLSAVCAGSHTVEFRSVAGRDVQRISLDSGAQVSVAGRMRAAFAILAAPQAANAPDVRLGVERAFASSRSLLLYAPAAEASRAAIEKETVNDEWFGLLPGQMGLPAGDRRGKLQRLADAFDAQGIAWVRPTTPGSNEVTVALEVPGGVSPDDLARRPRSPGQRSPGGQPSRPAADAVARDAGHRERGRPRREGRGHRRCGSRQARGGGWPQGGADHRVARRTGHHERHGFRDPVGHAPGHRPGDAVGANARRRPPDRHRRPPGRAGARGGHRSLHAGQRRRGRSAVTSGRRSAIRLSWRRLN